MKAKVRVQETLVRDVILTLEGESRAQLERQIAYIRETGELSGADEESEPNIVDTTVIDDKTESIAVESVRFDYSREDAAALSMVPGPTVR